MRKIKYSLSTKLLTRVLSVYFVVTLVVTSIHIVTEYFDARVQIQQELQMLQNTFNSSLTRAIWELNTPQVDSIASGFLEQSYVTGVQIWDDDATPIINLGETNEQKKPSHEIELISSPIKSDVIYSFPLIFEFSGRQSYVGEVSLYSNSKIVFNRIKVSIFFLFANAIIKSTFLVFLFLSAFRKLLTEPLEELTNQIYQFNVEDLAQSKLHLNTDPSSELDILQQNYNKLIDDLVAYQTKLTQTENQLKQANIQLDNHNFHLEQEVAKKTASLSQMMLNLEQQKNDILEKQRELKQENYQRSEAEKALIAKNKELATSMQTLKSTTEKLVESERMASLGGLVAGIAHDVNTPIGVSITASSFLHERLDKLEQAFNNKTLSNQDMSGFIEEARQTGDLLTNNLNRALNLISSFKQVAVDQTSEAEREIDLHVYISEIIASLAPTFKKTEHSISISCNENVVIVCPPGAIAQIITNMIMNSLNHGFENISEGKIKIDLSADEEEVSIIYTDNGSGIAKEDVANHFDAFMTTKRGAGGSGLGTHIMFNLVTQTLQGEITVQSQFGEGVKYQIHFPKKVRQR